MKKLTLFTLFIIVNIVAVGQAPKKKGPVKNDTENTLLWRISGKGLQKPSYLFGTMHLICADDIVISDSLAKAIRNADNVYLELDMENMVEMLGAMTKMRMRNDTTLADLLTKEEYARVKQYFSENKTMLPFSLLETFKPLMASSLIMQQQGSGSCANMISMEQLIMQEAKKSSVKIRGLETMQYQMSIFDSIPYHFQAKQLLQMIEGGRDEGSEMQLITRAYREQRLSEMDDMMKKEDAGMLHFSDILLYNRNSNWTNRLIELMPGKSLVIAVGAGHLPGDKGVINLLRKAGYKVEPVKNEMIRKNTKEI